MPDEPSLSSGVTVGGYPANPPSTYYPESYGAVGDGVTNDQVAIQAAINAAYAAGGGVVQLKAKTYMVRQDGSALGIGMKTGVTLRGMGMGQTTILTDNLTASSTYCLVHPFGYQSLATPMSAHDIVIEDLTLAGNTVNGGSGSNLHDLIAFTHVTKGIARRVGFNNTGAHFCEFNYCSNVLLEDCATVGTGDHGAAKFQLDAGGTAGQGAQPRFSTAISGAATYSVLGEQTLLTVASTAGMEPGDWCVITGANGANAANYNVATGLEITGIISGTQLCVKLPWTTATTAGTLTVQPKVFDITITGYKDKANTIQNIVYSRDFMELSHTSAQGRYWNITVQDSLIVPATYSVTTGGVVFTLGFDGGAIPREFRNFKFIRNTIRGGGETGQINVIDIATYGASPLSRISDIVISDNLVEDVGMYAFLRCGDVNSDLALRTSIALTDLIMHKNYTIENNVLSVIMKSGAVLQARATRLFIIGTMEKCVFNNNHVTFPNVYPKGLNGGAWVAWGTSDFVAYFNHVRFLSVTNNRVTVEQLQGPEFLYLCAFTFACSCFELASAGPMRAHQEWVNNTVVGQNTAGVGISVVRGFQEQLTNGSTGVANWANAAQPSVTGRWSGNAFYTSGSGATVDTWSTWAAHYNTPLNGGLTNAAITAANAAAWGRHDWWDGQHVIQTFSNAAVTVDPLTTILLQTGTMSASRVVTIPYAANGRPLLVMDKSGSVTGVNTLVLTRQNADLINGATTLTLNSAYGVTNIIPDRGTAWTKIP